MRSLFFCAILLLYQSSSTSHRTTILNWHPLRLYNTCWYDSSDSNYRNPSDSLKLFLSKSDADTLELPPWFSPATTFYFQMPARTVFSFQLSNFDASRCTKPIFDTLDIGVYGLRIDTASLRQGVYFYRRTIGGHVQAGKLIFAK